MRAGLPRENARAASPLGCVRKGADRIRTGVTTPSAVLAVRSPLRQYGPLELGKDGYPPEWHETIKHAVREQAEHRCVRCGHPYRTGEHGNGEWSPCDQRCTHRGLVRMRGAWLDEGAEWTLHDLDYRGENASGARTDYGPNGATVIRWDVEAEWRILTVHHLDGDKANCRWWNLAALCQRCHLRVQGRVVMARVWPWEHTEWFRPYVAGYYAWVYLGDDLTRDETEAQLVELLDLERAGPSVAPGAKPQTGNGAAD